MQDREHPSLPLAKPSLGLVGSSIWLGVGFVGAGVAAAELIQILAGPAQGLALSLALIASGIALAAFAWHSSWRMLTEEARFPAVAKRAPVTLAATPGSPSAGRA